MSTMRPAVISRNPPMFGSTCVTYYLRYGMTHWRLNTVTYVSVRECAAALVGNVSEWPRLMLQTQMAHPWLQLSAEPA